MNRLKTSIILTIDVEDWFQVENFKRYIHLSSWPSHELRVEKNVHRILDLFDSVELEHRSETRGHMTAPSGLKDNFDQRSACSNQPGLDECKIQSEKSSKSCRIYRSVKGTFFVLGWLAERLPHLVREIHSRGHEIASHGYLHEMSYKCSHDELRKDLSYSKNLLEDITGTIVYGYRAPSFSINKDVIKIVEDSGYLYDSSYNSFGLHDRYGCLDLTGFDKEGIAVRISDAFYELPISNLYIKSPWRSILSCISPEKNLVGFVIPCGGGGYFRLIPFPIFKKVIRTILKVNNAYLFYIHPWEIDPAQPRVSKAAKFAQFRHYFNLNHTYSRLSKLISSFPNSEFLTCHKYLTES